MASKLYISEYKAQAVVNGARFPYPQEPPAVEQVVDFSGGVARSNPFGPGTVMIRIEADSTCSVLVGDKTVIALNTSGRVAAGVFEFKFVKPDQCISAITNS